jgi:hypothetical protein
VVIHQRPEKKSLPDLITDSIKTMAAQIIGLDSPEYIQPTSNPLYADQLFDIRCTSVRGAKNYEWACRKLNESTPDSGELIGQVWKDQKKTAGQYYYFVRAVDGQVVSQWAKFLVTVRDVPDHYLNSVKSAYQSQTPQFEITNYKTGDHVFYPFDLKWPRIQQVESYIVCFTHAHKNNKIIKPGLEHNYCLVNSTDVDPGEYYVRITAKLYNGKSVDSSSIILKIMKKK